MFDEVFDKLDQNCTGRISVSLFEGQLLESNFRLTKILRNYCTISLFCCEEILQCRDERMLKAVLLVLLDVLALQGEESIPAGWSPQCQYDNEKGGVFCFDDRND